MTAVNVEPTPSVALDRHAAAEQLGELAAERQAEAGALHATLERAVDLRELLEDALLVLGGDADAGVGDRERDARRSSGQPARRHAHLAALGELERVGDEVAQDLRHLRLVGVERRHVAPAPRRRASTDSFTSSGRSMPRSAPNRCPTSNSIGRIDDLPGLDLGEVEQVVHQLAERVGGLADEGDLALLLGGEVAVGAVEQQCAPAPGSS